MHYSRSTVIAVHYITNKDSLVNRLFSLSIYTLYWAVQFDFWIRSSPSAESIQTDSLSDYFYQYLMAKYATNIFSLKYFSTCMNCYQSQNRLYTQNHYFQELPHISHLNNWFSIKNPDTAQSYSMAHLSVYQT